MKLHQKRIIQDKIYAQVFFILSLSSVVALLAILGFMLVQGTQPFLQPSRTQPIVVVENVEHVKLNGQEVTDFKHGITLPESIGQYDFTISNLNKEYKFKVDLTDQKEMDKMVHYNSTDGKIASEENYQNSISFKQADPKVDDMKITILMPQPKVSMANFFGQVWSPDKAKSYGVLSMIAATVVSAIFSILIAGVIGVFTAIFISQIAPKRTRAILKSGVELLAGIPSVVYGFFGLMVIVPIIQSVFNLTSGASLLAIIMVLSIMILPTVITISETSISAVESHYKEASLALGATKTQTIFRVIVPTAKSGILTSIGLGTGRALGETMAVILVAGNSVQMPNSLLQSVRTLTSTIALEMGYSQGVHQEILFSIGLILFLMILFLNVIILRISKRGIR